MRNEQEMRALIVETAMQDDRIRAVIMNGSRTNPNAPKDIFQDFDIVYLVTDVTPFIYAYEWIQRFGQLMILQMPEAMQDPPPSNTGSFVYLMQFTDGNRIDLTLWPLAKLAELGQDSLSILLLDKDKLLEPFTPPSDRDYLPTPPTAKAFFDCCNEFWWMAPYVAKGLWRDEITYAKAVMEESLRDQLMKMVIWSMGVKTQFAKSPGKAGKYLKQYLDPTLWDMLLSTYADAHPDNNWQALNTMCLLFRITAIQVAEHFSFDYHHVDDENVSAHLQHVRYLPKHVKAIY